MASSCHCILIISIILIIFHTDCESQCNDQYYFVSNQAVTYNQAHDYCMSQYGTHLATIFDDCGLDEIVAACSANSVSCWIGLQAVYNGTARYASSDGIVKLEYDHTAIPYNIPDFPWISPQPDTLQGTAMCTLYNGTSNQFELASCSVTNAPFFCNMDDRNALPVLLNGTTCEQHAWIKHIQWDELMAYHEYANESIVPFANYTMSVDKSTMDLSIEVELEYVGYSVAEKQMHVGSTYVLGFSAFEGDQDGIDHPGTCDNRKRADFLNKTWTEYWSYSDTPFLDGHIANESYLAYPPDTDFWHSYMDYFDPGSKQTASTLCTRVHYTATFSWEALVNDCKSGDGSRNLIHLETDNKWINLTGNFYGSLVSPVSGLFDSGFYRVYQLISQPFAIAVSKSSSVISSTGINLFTMSLIAVYKEDNEDRPTEDDFKMIVLTESADYLYLSVPTLRVTPDVSSATFTIVTQPYSGQECIVSTHSAICTQLWLIYAMNVECPPNTFSGTYAIQFNATCEGGTESATNVNVTDPCTEYIDTYGSDVLLSADLTWTDDICDEQVWVIQFEGEMNFYKDMIFTEPQADYLYVIGEDIVFVEVTINYPSSTYTVFQSSLTNVWVCTMDPDLNREENDELVFISQDLSNLGCLDESRTDQDGPYWIIQNYNEQFTHQATHHTVLDGSTNKVRFSFVVPDTIVRDTIYVHAQITLSLVENNGERRRVLLEVSGEHKPNQMSNPDPKQFAKNEDEVSNMDQIRHFGGSSGVRRKIFGDAKLRERWNKTLLIASCCVFVMMILIGFIGFKIHESDPINWTLMSDLVEQRRLRRLARLRMIGGDRRAYYGPVKHSDSESCAQFDESEYDDNDLLMAHDDGCNDHM